MDKKRHIFNIEWDTDGEPVQELPREIDVPARMSDDEVTDWLSDTYEFCVFGWEG